MATAKEQLDRIFRDIVETTDDLRSSRRLRELGEYAFELIVKRVRTAARGSVEKPGAYPKKLDELKESTKKKRRGVAALLHPLTSPNKSNLTYTGQMLNNMKVRVTKKGQVELGPRGRRKTIYGTKSKVTNEQVTIYVSKDRPFMSLSRGELTKVVKFYDRTFYMLLKRRGLT